MEAYANLLPLFQSLRAEVRSHGSIADELNRKGQRNQFGGMWKHDSVARLLRREGLALMKS